MNISNWEFFTHIVTAGAAGAVIGFIIVVIGLLLFKLIDYIDKTN